MTILTRVMGDTKRSWDVGLFVFFSVCDCMCEVHIICLELLLSIVYSFSLIFKKIVIYFMIALSLHWCMWAFSGYDEHGAVHAKSLSHVQLFATLWTVAFQAPLSMGFSRQKHWSGLPCPPPGDLPNSGVKPASLIFPVLACGSFTTSVTWKASCSSQASHCSGFFWHGALALGNWPSVFVVHSHNYPTPCGIFLNQGSNPCLLHRQVDYQPLEHKWSSIISV